MTLPDREPEWLAGHCWGCGRSESEVQADPRGRSAESVSQIAAWYRAAQP